MVLKPHRYGTRHLVAGDEYEVPLREAVALVVSKKAKFAVEAARPPDPPSQVPPPVRSLPEPAVGGDLEGLRARARAIGVEVDGRWGTARLRDEITKATAG